MFSATLPPEALEITRKFMNKPVGGGRNGVWRNGTLHSGGRGTTGVP